MSYFHKYLTILISVTSIAAVAAQRASLSNATLPHRMGYMHALYDGNNAIYLVGGSDGENTFPEIYKFDLSSETFQQVGTLFYGIRGGAASIYGDKIYTFGGTRSADLFITDAIYTYSNNNATGQPVYIGDVPQEFNFGAFAKDSSNNTFIFGGSGFGGYTNQIVRYSPGNNSAQVVGNLSYARSGSSAVYDGQNYIYVFGGWSRDPTYVQDIVRFNVRTYQVQTLSQTLPVGTAYGCAAYSTADNAAYFIGGMSGMVDQQGVRYQPASQTVQTLKLANFPDSLIGPGCVYVEKLRRIYVFGGSSSAFTNQIYVIDTSASSTTTTSSASGSSSSRIPASQGSSSSQPSRRPASNNSKQQLGGRSKSG